MKHRASQRALLGWCHPPRRMPKVVIREPSRTCVECRWGQTERVNEVGGQQRSRCGCRHASALLYSRMISRHLRSHPKIANEARAIANARRQTVANEKIAVDAKNRARAPGRGEKIRKIARPADPDPPRKRQNTQDDIVIEMTNVYSVTDMRTLCGQTTDEPIYSVSLSLSARLKVTTRATSLR